MKCPVCNGTGNWPNYNKLCQRCEGTGELPDYRRGNRTCPLCLGTGKWPSLRELCPTCEGWGLLPDEKVDSLVALFVKAGTPHKTRLKLKSLFKSIKGDIRICDPYYGQRSLIVLDSLTHCNSILFLTKTPDSRETTFINQVLVEFQSQNPIVEFRKYQGHELHDRYILSDDELVILGHGLKDIGSKDSCIVRLDKNLASGIMQDIRTSFDQKWVKADPIT
jgi:hypothetical protein